MAESESLEHIDTSRRVTRAVRGSSSCSDGSEMRDIWHSSSTVIRGNAYLCDAGRDEARPWRRCGEAVEGCAAVVEELCRS